MKASFKINKNESSLLIDIKPKPSNTIKMGMWLFYITPFSILFIFSVYALLIQLDKNKYDISLIVILGMAVVCVVFLKVFLKKIYHKETLILNQDSLKYINKSLLSEKKEKHFKREDIKEIKIADKERFTPHPIQTINPDYLGFENSEKEIKFLSEGGKIGLYLDKEIVRLGNNLDDESSTEIINSIYDFWR